MIISIDILYSWQNSHIDFLLYRVRATVAVKVNCILLNLQSQGEMANKKQYCIPTEMVWSSVIFKIINIREVGSFHDNYNLIHQLNSCRTVWTVTDKQWTTRLNREVTLIAAAVLDVVSVSKHNKTVSGTYHKAFDVANMFFSILLWMKFRSSSHSLGMDKVFIHDIVFKLCQFIFVTV